jgi:hypothetical protein
MAAQVTRFIAVHERSMAQLLRTEVPRLQSEETAAATGTEKPVVAATERDTRFDPEDEWAPESALRQEVAAQPPPSGRTFDHEDEDYPETWLR